MFTRRSIFRLLAAIPFLTSCVKAQENSPDFCQFEIESEHMAIKSRTTLACTGSVLNQNKVELARYAVAPLDINPGDKLIITFQVVAKGDRNA